MIRAVLLAATLPLAACSPAADPPAPEAPETAAADAPSAATQDLALLTPADYEAAPLEGELACAFTAKGGTLLAMRGNVADRAGKAQGLVKVGETRLRGESSETGGFDALPDGTRFTAEGLMAAVELTSNTPLAGGESPPFPARLTVRWTQGVERTYEGTWTCGP